MRDEIATLTSQRDEAVRLLAVARLRLSNVSAHPNELKAIDALLAEVDATTKETP